MYEHGRGVIKNYVLAFKYYHKSASQGYLSAQYNLACIDEHGRGTSKDEVMSMSWYKTTVEGGHDFAAKSWRRLSSLRLADMSPQYGGKFHSLFARDIAHAKGAGDAGAITCNGVL
jgi:TPR repeat protein